ncbi:PREDICTED: putative inorganic phosphate cotransporter [Papilio polytes]|uniref:putative inorganic phosphate cotransporter n=1 Tax=Papilio polytes TaxID=76194 RepID=UPI000676388D|nr:PREDICTED: putative inorganic phosphate cotransporter [Papilio polytes]
MKYNDNDAETVAAETLDADTELKGWGYRHQQCLILFFCLTTGYSMRACMGVSLVAMTTSDTTHSTLYNHTNIIFDNVTAADDDYKVDGFFSALLLSSPYPRFKWNKKTQDAILASFFWGYMVLQVPAGQLAHRLGARRLLAGALFANALVSFCLPWAAYYGGWIWVVIFRVMQGLSQACLMPGLHTFLGKWTPLRERSRLSAWKPKSVPWKKILTHRGMYAIIVAHIGQAWGQLTLYAEVPAFMDKVMGVNIKANGLLSALPFLVMWFTNFFFSWAADKLIAKKILSVTHTRKLANSVGNIPAAVGLVVLAFVPKELVIVESVLVILCGFKVATHVGVYVNHIDISPNFSGTMMSISNLMSNMCGSLAPIVAGMILTDVTSEYLWRQVFFVAAGIYFVTNIVYLALGTSERADWNDPPPSPEEEHTADMLEARPMLEIVQKSSQKDLTSN